MYVMYNEINIFYPQQNIHFLGEACVSSGRLLAIDEYVWINIQSRTH